MVGNIWALGNIKGTHECVLCFGKVIRVLGTNTKVSDGRKFMMNTDIHQYVEASLPTTTDTDSDR